MAASHPASRTGLRPNLSARCPATRLSVPFQTEGEHEARKEQKCAARHPEIARHHRKDDALHANDEADEEYLQHLQAELSPIRCDAARVRRRRDGAARLCPHAASPDGSPAFVARSSAALGGAGGMFSSMNATKRSASVIPKAAL